MIHKIFAVGYSTITILFVCCAVALIIFGVIELWHGINPTSDANLRERFNLILESIGILTISVAALELGQTILEEEVQREAQIGTPTRVRRFLSRFMIVIVVAFSIEALIAVFQFVHDEPGQLVPASMIAIAAAALLTAWGVFVKLNRSVEELEPEAMKRALSEDHKVE